MNTHTIILIVISTVAFFVLVNALNKLPKVRHAFIVPEGYVCILKNGKASSPTQTTEESGAS